MKKMQFLLSWAFCFLIFTGAKSQENQNQAYWIHEDRVKPGYIEEYENHSKNLVKMAKDNDFQEMGWSVAQMDDGTFLSVTPVDDFAHLQGLSFASLQEKVGEDNFSDFMNGFNKYYDEHGDYIVVLDRSLSYLPAEQQDLTGKDFRKWHFMQVPADKVSEMRQKLIELKDVHAKNNSKMHYSLYRTGFGQMGNHFVAVIPATNAEEYARLSAENGEILGDEGKKKFQEMLDLVSDYRNISGRMRPDLAYMPTTSEAQPIKND